MLMLISAAGDTAEVAPNAISGAQYLSALIGLVIPILVGLVTQHATDPRFKAILLAALSAVNGVLTEWLTTMNNGADFLWQQALFGAVLSFVASVATLYGFYKPTGIDDKLKAVGTGGKHNQNGALTPADAVGIVLIVLGAIVAFAASLWVGIVLIIVGVCVLIFV